MINLKINSVLRYLSIILFLPHLAGAITLNDALNSSLSNNLEVKIEELNLSASKENINQAISSYFPSVSLSGSKSDSEVTNIKSQSGALSPDYDLSPSRASVTISQNIFNGFGRYYALVKSKTDHKSQNLIFQNKKQEVILAALESYYDVLLSSKTYLSFKDNFAAIEQRHNSAIAEFDAGLLSKTDVAQAKTRMSLAKISMLNAEIILNNKKNIFYDIIGEDAIDLEFTNIRTINSYDQNKFFNGVQEGNFAIKLASLNVQSMSANAGIARSAMLPQISMSASKNDYYEYSSTIDQFNNETVSVTVSWPIFTSGKSLSKARQAKKIKNRSYISQTKVHQDTLTQAKFIWGQHSISKNTVAAALVAVESSEFAYNGTVIEQEVGERTLLDVLDARQQLLNAEIELFKEQRNEQIIVARMLYLMGDLEIEKLFNN